MTWFNVLAVFKIIWDTGGCYLDGVWVLDSVGGDGCSSGSGGGVVVCGGRVW